MISLQGRKPRLPCENSAFALWAWSGVLRKLPMTRNYTT